MEKLLNVFFAAITVVTVATSLKVFQESQAVVRHYTAQRTIALVSVDQAN